MATSFVGLALIGAAHTAPLAAELREGHFRIGVLVAVSASTTPSMAAFMKELQRLGYVEGQNTIIDPRSAEGEMGRLPDLAKELVTLAPDVIFAVGTPPVMALKSSGTSIPVSLPESASIRNKAVWSKALPTRGPISPGC